MCDIIPGQLIVSYPRDWFDIDIRRFERARHLESIDQKLEQLQLGTRKPSPSLHLLQVPQGEENHLTNEIYQWFSMNHNGRLPVVAPNYLLTVSGSSPASALAPSAQNFAFSPEYYSDYQVMTGLPASRSQNPLRILVVDTGIAPDHSLTLNGSKNILDPKNTSVDDDNGHGTAVALVVDDLAPGHEFIIYKAADSNGQMNEWDLLTALLADCGADVINLSVEYGLATRTCKVCGRQSSSSRSAVFEKILDDAANWSNKPLIVAAAGNGKATQLAYPSRFSDIVAVGSVNKLKDLAEPSNSGSSNHQGHLHQNHFAAPGGDSDLTKPEYVIRLASGTPYRGTSFACAFTSAAVLTAMSALGATGLLAYLQSRADKSFAGYTVPHHGNGVINV